MASRRRWTPAEIHILRTYWNQIEQPLLLQRLPGRPRAGVICKAIELGLPFGAPPSMWTLQNAARRLGLDVLSLSRVLTWADVPIVKMRSHWRFVDRELAEQAYRRWMRAETCRRAARRRRIGEARLRRAAVAAGVYPAERRYDVRLEGSVWDRIVASMTRKPYVPALTVGSAARSLGMHPWTLVRLFRAAGVPIPGKRRALPMTMAEVKVLVERLRT